MNNTASLPIDPHDISGTDNKAHFLCDHNLSGISGRNNFYSGNLTSQKLRHNDYRGDTGRSFSRPLDLGTRWH